jgi:hypothetical protein
MFEKIGRLAETAATKVSVSRRGFLGRLGQGALAMTGVLGGLLAIPRDTRAGGSYVCCKWICGGAYKNYGPKTQRKGCYPAGTNCSSFSPCGFLSGKLSYQKTVDSCTKC